MLTNLRTEVGLLFSGSLNSQLAEVATGRKAFKSTVQKLAFFKLITAFSQFNQPPPTVRYSDIDFPDLPPHALYLLDRCPH